MVEDLIRRARLRFILNETLGQTAFAAAVLIAGISLILVLGTRWLEWWTLSLFALIGVGWGAWRIYRALPDGYVTAVRLDANAGLSDTLSTALHFSEMGSDFQIAPFRIAQRKQADAVAGTVDLETAVPFTIPRTLYLMAGFAVLASALLLVRFSTGHGLDLRAPITEVLFEDQAANQLGKKKAAYGDPAKQKAMEAAESLLAKLGIPMNPDEKQSEAALAKAIDEALDGAAPSGDKGKNGPPGGQSDDGKSGNALQQSPDGDSMDGKSADSGEQNADSKAPDSKDGKAGDKGSPKGGQNADNNSLLSKLKDAVSNMMSKAGQDKGGQKGSQDQKQAKSDKASGEKGDSGKGKDQQGQQQGEAQAGDPNGDPQEGQQAEGKQGAKSAQSSSQAGSGVGSQDGAKDLKAFEQLKAMGKISEIIGKRAATVTGETTIEVQSGSQQLRTAYSTKSAAHGEADSDVTRDEIPVGRQAYVQQYFEQVRKTAIPNAKAPKAKAPVARPSGPVTK
jgi:hypothetical protein